MSEQQKGVKESEYKPAKDAPKKVFCECGKPTYTWGKEDVICCACAKQSRLAA